MTAGRFFIGFFKLFPAIVIATETVPENSGIDVH